MNIKELKTAQVKTILSLGLKGMKSPFSRFFTTLDQIDQNSVTIIHGQHEDVVFTDGETVEIGNGETKEITLPRQTFKGLMKIETEKLDRLPSLDASCDKTLKDGLSFITNKLKNHLSKEFSRQLLSAIKGKTGNVNLFHAFRVKVSEFEANEADIKKEGGLMRLLAVAKKLCSEALAVHGIESNGFSFLLGANLYSAVESAIDTKGEIKYSDDGACFTFRGVSFQQVAALGADEGLFLPNSEIFFVQPMQGTSEVNGQRPASAVTVEELKHGEGAEALGQNNYAAYCIAPEAVVRVAFKEAKAKG